MSDAQPVQPSLFTAVRHYWTDLASRSGPVRATSGLFRAFYEFLRDSTPEKLRQRFGDAEYDWEYRVNTTSGAVGWRDRLLGTLYSAYQPTDLPGFHEMIVALQSSTRINLQDFTFIDLGSGKGRTLLMASDYPFRKIVGVELLPSLHQIAQENIARYRAESQRCFNLESICADAANFPLPAGPLVVYLFNPFAESVVRSVAAHLMHDVQTNPRPAFVIYYNPEHENVLSSVDSIQKVAGTQQYSIFQVIADCIRS